MTDITNIKEALRAMARSAVRLSMRGGERAAGRFGGAPDVPPDFAWPYFETATFGDDTVKPRPLCFLAQFDCAVLSAFDPEQLLPRAGMLSFFYEMGSQRWGYDPGDAGCARVYWFPESAALAPAAFPEDLGEDYRFPVFPFFAQGAVEYPAYEDFSLTVPEARDGSGAWRRLWDAYDKAAAELNGGEMRPSHKVLGWPDIIQNNMTMECELTSQGFFMGGKWDDIPEKARQDAEQTSLEEWRLLFQLDSFSRDSFDGDSFALDFGDSGSVYFYIRKGDLAARRFDRVWLVSQCF